MCLCVVYFSIGVSRTHVQLYVCVRVCVGDVLASASLVGVCLCRLVGGGVCVVAHARATQLMHVQLHMLVCVCGLFLDWCESYTCTVVCMCACVRR